MNDSAGRSISEREKLERRQQWLIALGGPALLAAIHVVIYVAHRAMMGTAPAEMPGELVSLVIFLVGFQVWLYRLGTSWKLQIISVLFSVVSLAIAPVAGFVMIVLISAK